MEYGQPLQATHKAACQSHGKVHEDSLVDSVVDNWGLAFEVLAPLLTGCVTPGG